MTTEPEALVMLAVIRSDYAADIRKVRVDRVHDDGRTLRITATAQLRPDPRILHMRITARPDDDADA